MMSFIHIGSEIKIYSISSGNKLETIRYMTAQVFRACSLVVTNFRSKTIGSRFE